MYLCAAVGEIHLSEATGNDVSLKVEAAVPATIDVAYFLIYVG